MLCNLSHNFVILYISFRDSQAMIAPQVSSRARSFEYISRESTRYENSQPSFANKNYLMYVYMEVVSCWIIQEHRDFSRSAQGFADYIWREYRHYVEGSYETLECNLGRPCLPESLIIALAHRGIKRKLVDRASWQYNAKQTDLALRGNFKVTIAMTYRTSRRSKYMYSIS